MTPGTELKNLNILVTRPARQQESLCTAIREQGGQPLSLPLIAIDAIEDRKALQRLREQVQHLDNYQRLIFVSTNAADFGAELIDAYWPQFPVGVEVLAIGPSTADRLQSLLHCEVSRADGGMNSEAILALPQLQDIAEQRIAIFRGQGGRELLADTLRERGARVDYFEVYRRREAEHPEGCLSALLEDPGIDVLTLTSGESLAVLLSLAGSDRDRLNLIPLVVPSARVAGLAREAGFARVHDARGANDAALLAALREIAAGADNQV